MHFVSSLLVIIFCSSLVNLSISQEISEKCKSANGNVYFVVEGPDGLDGLGNWIRTVDFVAEFSSTLAQSKNMEIKSTVIQHGRRPNLVVDDLPFTSLQDTKEQVFDGRWNEGQTNLDQALYLLLESISQSPPPKESKTYLVVVTSGVTSPSGLFSATSLLHAQNFTQILVLGISNSTNFKQLSSIAYPFEQWNFGENLLLVDSYPDLTKQLARNMTELIPCEKEDIVELVTVDPDQGGVTVEREQPSTTIGPEEPISILPPVIDPDSGEDSTTLSPVETSEPSDIVDEEGTSPSEEVYTEPPIENDRTSTAPEEIDPPLPEVTTPKDDILSGLTTEPEEETDEDAETTAPAPKTTTTEPLEVDVSALVRIGTSPKTEVEEATPTPGDVEDATTEDSIDTSELEETEAPTDEQTTEAIAEEFTPPPPEETTTARKEVSSSTTTAERTTTLQDVDEEQVTTEESTTPSDEDTEEEEDSVTDPVIGEKTTVEPGDSEETTTLPAKTTVAIIVDEETTVPDTKPVSTTLKPDPENLQYTTEGTEEETTPQSEEIDEEETTLPPPQTPDSNNEVETSTMGKLPEVTTQAIPDGDETTVASTLGPEATPTTSESFIPETTRSVTTLDPDCSDKDSFCPQWASKGHCTSNPVAMNSLCRKSCGACAMTKREMIIMQYKYKNCENLWEGPPHFGWCTSFTDQECADNLMWAAKYCRKHCKLCY